MKRNCLLIALLALVLLAGCAPKTFVKTLEPTWATVELREDITYNEAWNTVVDTLVKDFDMEVLSKRDGYVRTNWLYTWTGKVRESYRDRKSTRLNSSHYS